MGLMFTSVAGGALTGKLSDISAEEPIFDWGSGKGSLAGGSSGRGLSMAESSKLMLLSVGSSICKKERIIRRQTVQARVLRVQSIPGRRQNQESRGWKHVSS